MGPVVTLGLGMVVCAAGKLDWRWFALYGALWLVDIVMILISMERDKGKGPGPGPFPGARA